MRSTAAAGQQMQWRVAANEPLLGHSLQPAKASVPSQKASRQQPFFSTPKDGQHERQNAAAFAALYESQLQSLPRSRASRYVRDSALRSLLQDPQNIDRFGQFLHHNDSLCVLPYLHFCYAAGRWYRKRLDLAAADEEALRDDVFTQYLGATGLLSAQLSNVHAGGAEAEDHEVSTADILLRHYGAVLGALETTHLAAFRESKDSIDPAQQQQRDRHVAGLLSREKSVRTRDLSAAFFGAAFEMHFSRSFQLDSFRCLKGQGMQGVVALIIDAGGTSLIVKMLDAAHNALCARELVFLHHLGCDTIVRLVPDVSCLLDSRLFIAQEALLGHDLNQLIESSPRPLISTAQLLEWIQQILRAVAYIHSADVVHGDLKLDNVFLTETHDAVRIGDFGVAVQYSPGDDYYEELDVMKGDDLKKVAIIVDLLYKELSVETTSAEWVSAAARIEERSVDAVGVLEMLGYTVEGTEFANGPEMARDLEIAKSDKGVTQLLQQYAHEIQGPQPTEGTVGIQGPRRCARGHMLDRF